MKIRNGFVSNSSSSSFVLFASKEAFDLAQKDLTDNQKKAIAPFISSTDKFLGRDMLCYRYTSGDYGDEEFARDVVKEFTEDEAEIEDLCEFVFGHFDVMLKKASAELDEGCLTYIKEH